MGQLLAKRGVARTRVVAVIGVASVWQPVGTAIAQVPSINFRRSYTPMHPDASFSGETTRSLPAWQPHVGIWSSLAKNVVEIRTLDGEVVATPLEHQFVMDAFVNWGLGRRLTVGASMPAVIYQTGDTVQVHGIRSEEISNSAR